MTIDLVDEKKIKVQWSELKGVTTISIKNEAGQDIGEMQIESSKMIAFFESMLSTAKERTPELAPRDGVRQHYSVQTGSASIEFL